MGRHRGKLSASLQVARIYNFLEGKKALYCTRQFGPIRIEWPGKDNSPSPPKGYVYIIFDQVPL